MTIGARAFSLRTGLSGWLAALAFTGCGGSVAPGAPGNGGAGDHSTGSETTDAGPRCTGPACASACPPAESLSDGDSCTFQGQECPSDNLPTLDCMGAPTGAEHQGDCECSSGRWSCPPLTTPCASLSLECPDPSMVVPGKECSVIAGLDCMSNSVPLGCVGTNFTLANGTCICDDGLWSTGHPLDDCPPPACPDPSAVHAGASCSTAPAPTCPGNPHPCGEGIFYDNFRCANEGYWLPITTTTCLPGGDIDGGVEDASFGDDAGADTP